MKHIALTAKDMEEAVRRGRQNIETRRALGPEPSSALVWYPPVYRAGLVIPRTEIVSCDFDALWPVMDGKPEMPGFPWGVIGDACEHIGYPVFIRTDLSSAKHSGPSAYRADRKEDIRNVVLSTFEDNAIKDFAPFLCALMVREWLSLDAAFTAFRGHPIAREWRLFVVGGRACCSHFYWPEEAFEWQRPEEPAALLEWHTRYNVLRRPLEDDVARQLRNTAEKAVHAIGHGDWSVDFALDRSGRWWLIDMAIASESWHPKDCRSIQHGNSIQENFDSTC